MCGVLVLIIGTQSKDPLDIILTTIAGALIGTSIPSLVYSYDTSLIELIEKNTSIPNFSSSSQLDMVRTKFYLYHNTTKNGKSRWELWVDDFRNSDSTNYINCKRYRKQGLSTKSEYNGIGMLTDNTLILTYKGISSEEIPVVYIIRDILKQYKDYRLGMAFFETFDGNETVSPVILTFKPLFGVKTEGQINDSLLLEKLNKLGQECLDSYPIQNI